MQTFTKKRWFYLLGAILGILMVVGVYEFVQYRHVKQQDEEIRRAIEHMQKQGLDVSVSENGVVTVRP